MEIQVWSDFACPWCALGFARLDVALSQFEHAGAVRTVHRSFELDRSAAPKTDVTMNEALRRKYGMGPEQIAAGHARLTAMGAEVGFEFRFERVQLTNTFDAHRLAQAARGTEHEHAVVAALFRAYFTDGQLLSDHDVLHEVAVSAGLESHIAEKVLAGDLFAREVRLDEASAQEREVTGVPYFLINDSWAVPGAQDVETLVTVLDRAWARSAE
jgi:predicted DsbA family dithiol-disulfide isomerase